MSELKAASCRVSTNHDEQVSSLQAQTSYYERLIVEHDGWKPVRIYGEQASGAQIKKHPEFLKILKACKQDRVDLILTRSISRFGRNKFDTLITLHELFNLCADIKRFTIELLSTRL